MIIEISSNVTFRSMLSYFKFGQGITKLQDLIALNKLVAKGNSLSKYLKKIDMSLE
jgi:hypothetical protein